MSKLLYSILFHNKELCAHRQRSASTGIDNRQMITTLITMKQWVFLAEFMREKPDYTTRYIDVVERGQKMKRLPIHQICRHKPPLDLIKIVVSAYPISLAMKDPHNGSTALHFACRFGASEEVIQYLLRKYPDAANIENKYGCTPVMLARRGSYKHKDAIIRLFDNLHLDEDDEEFCSKRCYSVCARSA